MDTGLAIGLALPRSLPGALALLTAILIAAYILLCAMLRVEPPHRRRPAESEADAEGVEEQPDNVSAEPASDETAAEEPAPDPAEPVTVESVRVGEMSIAVGDASGRVMTAFRRAESAMTPLVERNEAGQACHVIRAYEAGRRRLTITLEREESGQPLRLTRVEIG